MKEKIDQLEKAKRIVEKFKPFKMTLHKEDAINDIWKNGCDFGFNEGLNFAIKLLGDK